MEGEESLKLADKEISSSFADGNSSSNALLKLANQSRRRGVHCQAPPLQLYQVESTLPSLDFTHIRLRLLKFLG